jgi:hypothetical protein
MAHLEHRDDAPSLVSLEHPHLPERSIRVEGAARQPGDGVAQLVPASRCAKHQASNVPIEVELRVVDPDRMVEIERHPHGAPAQGRVDRDLEGVLGLCGPFVVDELGIVAGHPTHRWGFRILENIGYL